MYDNKSLKPKMYGIGLDKEKEINTKYDFGKYKGIEIDSIIEFDCDYIFWCNKNVDFFILSENAIKKIEKILKDLIFIIKKSNYNIFLYVKLINQIYNTKSTKGNVYNQILTHDLNSANTLLKRLPELYSKYNELGGLIQETDTTIGFDYQQNFGFGEELNSHPLLNFLIGYFDIISSVNDSNDKDSKKEIICGLFNVLFNLPLKRDFFFFPNKIETKKIGFVNNDFTFDLLSANYVLSKFHGVILKIKKYIPEGYEFHLINSLSHEKTFKIIICNLLKNIEKFTDYNPDFFYSAYNELYIDAINWYESIKILINSEDFPNAKLTKEIKGIFNRFKRNKNYEHFSHFSSDIILFFELFNYKFNDSSLNEFIKNPLRMRILNENNDYTMKDKNPRKFDFYTKLDIFSSNLLTSKKINFSLLTYFISINYKLTQKFLKSMPLKIYIWPDLKIDNKNYKIMSFAHNIDSAIEFVRVNIPLKYKGLLTNHVKENIPKVLEDEGIFIFEQNSSIILK